MYRHLKNIDTEAGLVLYPLSYHTCSLALEFYVLEACSNRQRRQVVPLNSAIEFCGSPWCCVGVEDHMTADDLDTGHRYIVQLGSSRSK